jgi:hypothetical protein
MHEILTALVIIALWAGWVALFPTKACDRGPCPRCDWSGRRFRVGARLVRRRITWTKQHTAREVAERKTRGGFSHR